MSELINGYDLWLDIGIQVELDDRVSEPFGVDPGIEDQELCYDCGKPKPLREYEKDNLAGTAVLHIEIYTDCYEERTL